MWQRYRFLLLKIGAEPVTLADYRFTIFVELAAIVGGKRHALDVGYAHSGSRQIWLVGTRDYGGWLLGALWPHGVDRLAELFLELIEPVERVAFLEIGLSLLETGLLVDGNCCLHPRCQIGERGW